MAAIDQAVTQLNGRVQAGGLDGTARFVLTGEGSILMDAGGARPWDDAGDGPADVTLTADSDTFRSILAGETNATAAFMSGKLTVDGDMGMAMRLASLLG